MAQQRQSRQAFTLIELLIVVAIIGILAAIAIPNFNAARVRGTVARAKADMRTVAMANHQYALDNGMFLPDGNDALAFGGGRPVPSRFMKGAVYGNMLQLVNERVWMRLTTPVSYLSQIIYDPFGKITAGERKTGYADGVSFFYDTLDGTFLGVKGPEIHAMWILGSMGPDLTCGDSYRDTYQGGPIGYDASNGLRSRGDIMRLPVLENPGGWAPLFQRYRQQGAEG